MIRLNTVAIALPLISIILVLSTTLELARNLQESRAQFEQQATDRQIIIDRGTLDPDFNSAFYDVEIAKDNIAIIDGQLESLWLRCDCASPDDIDLVKFMDIPIFSEGTLIEDLNDCRVLDSRLEHLDENDVQQAQEIELLNRERAKIQSKIYSGLDKRQQWRHEVAAGMSMIFADKRKSLSRAPAYVIDRLQKAKSLIKTLGVR